MLLTMNSVFQLVIISACIKSQDRSILPKLYEEIALNLAADKAGFDLQRINTLCIIKPSFLV